MATSTDLSFRGVRKKQYAKISERESAEAKYWRQFNTTGETKLEASPNFVSFCENAPKCYLVTGGNAVHLYDSSSDKVQRSYTRFTDNAYSGRLRRDGKLLVAGEKTGHVKIFDTDSKFMLRDLRGHTGAVRSTTWTSDGLSVISGSDDALVKKWDLSTGALQWCSDGNIGGNGGGVLLAMRITCGLSTCTLRM